MSDNDKTQIFNYGNASKSNKEEDKTQHLNKDENVAKTQLQSPPTAGDQTIIIGQGSSNSEKTTTKRKLVGWLVSYTLDEAGTDFRLFEGKNKLGRNQSNDIRIFQDPKISGEHATLLFRGNDLYVKDELASNPSFHNSNEIKPGQTVEVADGDKLQFGDNEFIFRKAWL
ncbi:MAG: FHA domain-containing protein [Crocinitomicaceae bacterium]|nr:FHA domain-containing protein [Crocinitomicaceae bacterium]